STVRHRRSGHGGLPEGWTLDGDRRNAEAVPRLGKVQYGGESDGSDDQDGCDNGGRASETRRLGSARTETEARDDGCTCPEAQTVTATVIIPDRARGPSFCAPLLRTKPTTGLMFRPTYAPTRRHHKCQSLQSRLQKEETDGAVRAPP